MTIEEKKALLHYANRKLADDKMKMELTDCILEESNIPYPILENLHDECKPCEMQDGIEMHWFLTSLLIDRIINDDSAYEDIKESARMRKYLEDCLDKMDDEKIGEEIDCTEFTIIARNKVFGKQTFRFYWSAQFYNSMTDALEYMMQDW